MRLYKAIILDDEINNISILKDVVSNHCSNVKIVGHAMAVPEIASVVEATQPDIIFLDIRLKGKEVFEAFDTLDITKTQLIFVVPANDKYPLKAIKYNAIDYILKPVIIEELVLATNKAIKKIEQQKYIEFRRSLNINETQNKTVENNNYIAITSLDKIELLKIKDIIYAVSDSKYTTFHTINGKQHVSNKNMFFYENALDKSLFFRIHRTYMINIKFMSKMIKTDGYYCVLANGIFLPIAKRKQTEFNRFLKIKI